MISGGEPLAWRDGGRSVLDLAERFPDCFFVMYTNGTLLDDAVAKRLGRLGNVCPALSIEGMRERTDARRGDGVFDKVLAAMERLRREGVIIGVSLTATRENADEILSDEVVETFFDGIGASYAFVFHYMPMGRSFTLDLMMTPEQRLRLFERVWWLVRNRHLFITDFWNSATATNGCLAAGRAGGYFHVNWNGDVSPCVFFPYSPVNVQDVFARGGTLDDVWAHPFFADIRRWQRAHGYREANEPCPDCGNWMAPCIIRDHHAEFMTLMRRHEPAPLDDDARAALADPEYHVGLERFGRELEELDGPGLARAVPAGQGHAARADEEALRGGPPWKRAAHDAGGSGRGRGDRDGAGHGRHGAGRVHANALRASATGSRCGATRPVQKGLAGLPWPGEWLCGRCGETTPGRLLHEPADDAIALEHDCPRCGLARARTPTCSSPPRRSKTHPRQPRETFAGAPIRPIPRALPRTVETLCPECSCLILGRSFERDGAVWMEKTCPEHGYFRDKVTSDARLYLLCEERCFEDERGVEARQTRDAIACPTDCGLCAQHQSTTCLGQVDLSQPLQPDLPGLLRERQPGGLPRRADLRRGGRDAAGAARAEAGPGRRRPVHRAASRRCTRSSSASWTAAREMGFSHVQIASNGLKFAEPGFAEQAAAAGLQTLYLQFDGIGRRGLPQAARRRRSSRRSKAAVEACRRAGIRICLVPTIVKGVNDDQVGADLPLRRRELRRDQRDRLPAGLVHRPDRPPRARGRSATRSATSPPRSRRRAGPMSTRTSSPRAS